MELCLKVLRFRIKCGMTLLFGRLPPNKSADLFLAMTETERMLARQSVGGKVDLEEYLNALESIVWD